MGRSEDDRFAKTCQRIRHYQLQSKLEKSDLVDISQISKIDPRTVVKYQTKKKH